LFNDGSAFIPLTAAFKVLTKSFQFFWFASVIARCPPAGLYSLAMAQSPILCICSAIAMALIVAEVNEKIGEVWIEVT